MKRTTPGTAEAKQAIRAMKLLETVGSSISLINSLYCYWDCWRCLGLCGIDHVFNGFIFQIIQQSNDSISQMKSIESLVSLNAKVDFDCKVRKIKRKEVKEEMNPSFHFQYHLHGLVFVPFQTLPLISQSRRWVREGPVIELIDLACKDPERNLYLHLFNDYLLLSLQKEWDTQHFDSQWYWKKTAACWDMTYRHVLPVVFVLSPFFVLHSFLPLPHLSFVLSFRIFSRGGRFTVINHAPVNEVQVENCRIKLHSLQKNLFRLQMSTKFYLLKTDTQ